MLLTPSICLAWKWKLCVRDKTIRRHISWMSDGSLEEFLLITWTTAKLSMCKTTVLSDNKCIQNSNTITIDRQKLSKWSVNSIQDMGKGAYNHVPLNIQLKPKLLAPVNRCKQEEVCSIPDRKKPLPIKWSRKIAHVFRSAWASLSRFLWWKGLCRPE